MILRVRAEVLEEEVVWAFELLKLCEVSMGSQLCVALGRLGRL